MSIRKLVILGSGATAGTIPDCPPAAGFGTALRSRRPDWQKAYPVLAQVVKQLSPERQPDPLEWNLSHVWTQIDYYSKLCSFLGKDDYGPAASSQICDAVLDVYGKFASDAIKQPLNTNKPFTLRTVIQELVKFK